MQKFSLSIDLSNRQFLFHVKQAATLSCMVPLLCFHRHSGVLWSHAVEHAEELRAEAGGGQSHGRAVGEDRLPTKVWPCTHYLPSGGGESVGVDKKIHMCIYKKNGTCVCCVCSSHLKSEALEGRGGHIFLSRRKHSVWLSKQCV